MLIGWWKKTKQLFIDYDNDLMFVFYSDLNSVTDKKQKLVTEMMTPITNTVIKALNIFCCFTTKSVLEFWFSYRPIFSEIALTVGMEE